MTKLILPIVLLIFTGCIEPNQVKNRSHVVASMAATLDKQFPGTPQMSKDNLPEQYILVDVREKAERMVSTLPQAISIKQYEKDRKQLIASNQVIVAYDTLGKRAIAWVQKERALGANAYNLHGGLLAWAHEGGIFLDVTGNHTKRVHVYAEAWDMLPDGYEAITQ
jgi:rhodanese-related sulfurtransferase